MTNINRFFECALPNSVCNLKCDYCYVIQENRRKMENMNLDYPVEHILQALSKERLGGICYFNLCSIGETMLQNNLIELVHGLLLKGHYVNITTNGTITSKIEKLINGIDKKYLNHLNMSFSFHYLELVKLDLIDTFFNNIENVKKAGVSILVQLNLYDGYIDHIDEIKSLCIERVGALPQLATTRRELPDRIEIMTSKTTEEYRRIGSAFDSPLFSFTMENFNIKRKEFCYAGDWSVVLDMKTGIMSKCYGLGRTQNIFEDLSSKIKFEAIGHNCPSPYCVNSSHFMSLGVIPSINTLSYANLRNRKSAHWYSDDMNDILQNQFKSYKKEYCLAKKIYVTLKVRMFRLLYKLKQYLYKYKRI